MTDMDESSTAVTAEAPPMMVFTMSDTPSSVYNVPDGFERNPDVLRAEMSVMSSPITEAYSSEAYAAVKNVQDQCAADYKRFCSPNFMMSSGISSMDVNQLFDQVFMSRKLAETASKSEGAQFVDSLRSYYRRTTSSNNKPVKNLAQKVAMKSVEKKSKALRAKGDRRLEVEKAEAVPARPVFHHHGMTPSDPRIAAVKTLTGAMPLSHGSPTKNMNSKKQSQPVRGARALEGETAAVAEVKEVAPAAVSTEQVDISPAAAQDAATAVPNHPMPRGAWPKPAPFGAKPKPAPFQHGYLGAQFAPRDGGPVLRGVTGGGAGVILGKDGHGQAPRDHENNHEHGGEQHEVRDHAPKEKPAQKKDGFWVPPNQPPPPQPGAGSSDTQGRPPRPSIFQKAMDFLHRGHGRGALMGSDSDSGSDSELEEALRADELAKKKPKAAAAPAAVTGGDVSSKAIAASPYAPGWTGVKTAEPSSVSDSSSSSTLTDSSSSSDSSSGSAWTVVVLDDQDDVRPGKDGAGVLPPPPPSTQPNKGHDDAHGGHGKGHDDKSDHGHDHKGHDDHDHGSWWGGHHDEDEEHDGGHHMRGASPPPPPPPSPYEDVYFNGALGYSADGDMCMYENFDSLSQPCVQAVSDMYQLRSDFWTDTVQASNGHHHIGMVLFFLLLGFVGIRRCMWRGRVKKVKTFMQAIHENPALKAQIEAETGMAVPELKCCKHGLRGAHNCNAEDAEKTEEEKMSTFTRVCRKLALLVGVFVVSFLISTSSLEITAHIVDRMDHGQDMDASGQGENGGTSFGAALVILFSVLAIELSIFTLLTKLGRKLYAHFKKSKQRSGEETCCADMLRSAKVFAVLGLVVLAIKFVGCTSAHIAMNISQNLANGPQDAQNDPEHQPHQFNVLLFVVLTLLIASAEVFVGVLIGKGLCKLYSAFFPAAPEDSSPSAPPSSPVQKKQQQQQYEQVCSQGCAPGVICSHVVAPTPVNGLVTSVSRPKVWGRWAAAAGQSSLFSMRRHNGYAPLSTDGNDTEMITVGTTPLLAQQQYVVVPVSALPVTGVSMV